MIPHVLKKIAWALFTIWAVVTLTFFVFNLLPEDPARVIAGPQARPAEVEKIRKQLGLDQAIHRRYARYMSTLVSIGEPAEKSSADNSVMIGPIRLDLGESYLRRQPVVKLLAKKLPATILLGGLALLFQVVIGTAFGVLAASRRHSVLDWGTVALTLIGISAPTFLTGLALQHFFARTLRWFPLDGYGETSLQQLHAATLPALTLGLFGAAYYTRLVRDEMIGLLKQDYVRTAQAKGQSARLVLVKHALRNALLPLVTVVGLNMGVVVGGAIVTEQIFRWPGIGKLTVEAIRELDGPVVMGVVLLFSTVVVISNLIVDLSYAALDPRVRAK